MTRSIWTNDVDFIVAETRDEAYRILCGQYGALCDDFDRDDLYVYDREGDFSVGVETEADAQRTADELLVANAPAPGACFTESIRVERDGKHPWPVRVVADVSLWTRLPSGYLACTEY